MDEYFPSADLPGAKDAEVLFGPIKESLRKQLPLLGLLLCIVKGEFCIWY